MAYDEPIDKLTTKTQDICRALTSMKEEIEAIDWYQQRIDVCSDPDLRDILAHNRDEEKEHASMLLEWLRRQDKNFDKTLDKFLFTTKKIDTI